MRVDLDRPSLLQAHPFEGTSGDYSQTQVCPCLNGGIVIAQWSELYFYGHFGFLAGGGISPILNCLQG
jgi:hypothetical protein